MKRQRETSLDVLPNKREKLEEEKLESNKIVKCLVKGESIIIGKETISFNGDKYECTCKKF